MKGWVKILLAAAILAVVVGYLSLSYAIEHVLSYSPIRPTRCTQEDVRRYFGRPMTPAAVGLQWAECDITVEDSIRLRGWFVHSALAAARGTVFLLHGIASCRASLIPLAQILAAHGFNCVLYDSRANGESGGINCTFGYFEKRDLSAYIDSASERFPGSGPYAVFGNSLGGAVALQAMADDKRIVCGIVESPFANLRAIIRDLFAQAVFLRIDAIADRSLVYTERIAHFSIDSVQPALSARSVTQPCMVIHGLNDAKVDPSYGREVFDNLASAEKEWFPIPEGDHLDLPQKGGEAYRQRIVRFFTRHMGGN